MKKFQSGDHVLLRDIQVEKVLFVLPATVVTDEPNLLVCWVSPDTPAVTGELAAEPHTPEAVRCITRGEWTMKRRKWEGRGCLTIAEPGAAWRMMVFWNGQDETVSSWYVNLESPLQRVDGGFDYTDKMLDILWRPTTLPGAGKTKKRSIRPSNSVISLQRRSLSYTERAGRRLIR
jgi:hypothetical protein